MRSLSLLCNATLLLTLGLCNLAHAQSSFATATYAEVLMPDQTSTFTYSYLFNGSDSAGPTSGTGTIDYQYRFASSLANYYYTVIESGASASPTGYASTTDGISTYLLI